MADNDDTLEKAAGSPGAMRAAAQGGGTVSPVSPMGPGMGGYQLNYRNPNYAAGIVTGTGADWFGPLNPMQPTAPIDVKGRVLDFPSGYNLDIRPRAYEAISFAMLRNFADSYDILRLLIETRKDQMARLKWNIVPRDRKKAKQIPAAMQTLIDQIELFFFKPDKEHFWGDWLRMILEDLLVCDAPAVYKRRTYGGQLFALQPLDGGTIKRVIDDWGNTPIAPVPAYQQVLKGYPAVDYTSDELIYMPRNRRTHKVYGYSPVEQIVMTINIGMRRQVWQLESFTEGNIPEALIGTPSTWTPDQVRSFQEWFDMMLVGQTGERRRARFVPGDVAKGYVPTKPDQLFDGITEEWLVRVMCFCFNVSPQPFVKMMNRATAESAQEAAAEEGLAPLQNWVKGLIDSIILDEFQSMDVEFAWLDESELDPQVKSTIVLGETSKSLITLNEGRAEMGLDPIPDCPEADRLMAFTPTGWVPFALTQQEKDDQAQQQQAQAQQSHQNTLEQIKAKGAAGVTEQPGDGSEGASGGAPGSSGTDGAAASAGASEAAAVAKADGAGSAGGGGVSAGAATNGASTIPAPTSATSGLQGYDLEGEQSRPFVKAQCLCGERHALAKAGGTPATEPQPGDPLRPKIAKIEKAVKASLSAMLSNLGDKVVKQFKAKAPNVVSKMDGDDADWDDFDLDDFMDKLDLSSVETSQSDLEDGLAETFEDTARVSIAVIGPKNKGSMFEQVHDRALIWAKQHAADLVGRSDDAEYAIDDATRDMIRASIASGIEDNKSMLQIAADLIESYAFSDERAHTIASTEITSANSLGALAGYEEVKADGGDVKKSWLVMETGCDVCQENADAGAIELDEEFPSGDQAPGAHPHCRCVLVPVVGANDNEADADEEVEDVAEEGDDTMEEFDKPGFTKSDDQPRDDHGRFASEDGGGKSETDLKNDYRDAFAARLYGGNEDRHSLTASALKDANRSIATAKMMGSGDHAAEAKSHRDAAKADPKSPNNDLRAAQAALHDHWASMSKADWDEDAHPRDEHGQFTDGGGGDTRPGGWDGKSTDNGYTTADERVKDLESRGLADKDMVDKLRSDEQKAKDVDSKFTGRELTKPEQGALNMYTSNAFAKVNTGLRNDDPPASRANQIARLDAAIASEKTTEPMTVYRGIVDKNKTDWQPGMVVTDKAYQSTTYNQSNAMMYATQSESKSVVPTVFEIKMPAGQEALNVHPGRYVGGAHSEEIVLGRNTSYRVTGTRTETHGYNKTGFAEDAKTRNVKVVEMEIYRGD